MASKERISVNAFDKAFKQCEDVNVTMTWNDMEFTVKKRLDCKTAMSFVSMVTTGCIGEDKEYHPEAKRIAIRLATIAAYTNLSIPRSIEKQYDMAYAPGLYDIIMNTINQEEYTDICNIINENIEMYIREKTDVINKTIADLSSAIDNVQDKFGNVFEGIDKDEIKTLFETMSNGTIDEEKIANAYIKAANKQ